MSLSTELVALLMVSESESESVCRCDTDELDFTSGRISGWQDELGSCSCAGNVSSGVGVWVWVWERVCRCEW